MELHHGLLVVAPGAGANSHMAATEMSTASPDRTRASDIAIVGIHCRVPGASDPDQFWINLRSGVDAMELVTDEMLRAAAIPESRFGEPGFVRVVRQCADAHSFDAGFFGMTPREAQITDPQTRVFMETAWELFERAGYDPHAVDGLIGVYAGMGVNEHAAQVLADRHLAAWAGRAAIRIANDRGALATTTSYKLNLKGPSLTIQTACSTSLVAVHLACQGLLEGDCDMALAGGVSIDAFGASGYLFEDGGILSPDGRCRAFDAKARGTVAGSGACVVLLKRLADALADGDQIHAVIKGTAINNDGSSKVGYTAPSVSGQTAVIRSALAAADVDADSISYVEAHGTGTPLGDPVEVGALTQAFRATTSRRQFCALGSVKSNIGHLDAAAGAASLIKVVLALRHRQIPASLHVEEPNPKMELGDSPFFVNATLRDWTGPRPLRAGVSSFGIGGTNAHVIVEEPPDAGLPDSKVDEASHLLVLSARTPTALADAARNLGQHLRTRQAASLADTACTLQVGRRHFSQRRMLVCTSAAQAAEALSTADPDRSAAGVALGETRPVVFSFPGQGTQFAGMAQGLYETEPRFQRVVDRCCAWLQPTLGFDLREILYPGDDRLEEARERLFDTAIAQPALFVTEYALATLWREWGITPAGMIGHSLGEYVAACMARVFTERDALEVVAARGALMQRTARGAMLAIEAAEDDVRRFLPPELSIAAVNAPRQCVVAGSEDDAARLARDLSERSIVYRRLPTSRAFHSPMMEPILQAFFEKVSAVPLQAPDLRFVSNLTGRWIEDAEATDPGYWVRHVRYGVQFANGLDAIVQSLPGCVWLETGPGHTLSRLVRQRFSHTALSPMEARGARSTGVAPYLDALGRLWLSGVGIDWKRYQGAERRRRVILPTYPFERQLYRPGSTDEVPEGGRAALVKRAIEDWFYVPVWKQSSGIDRSSEPRARDRWLILGHEDAFTEHLVRRLKERAAVVITAWPGDSFCRVAGDAWRIRPGREQDYGDLLRALATEQQNPDRIVHLWGLGAGDRRDGSSRDSSAGGDTFLDSVLSTVKAVGRSHGGGKCGVDVVATGTQAVVVQEDIDPHKAAVLGLCAVVAQEYPGVHCRTVDMMGPLRGAGPAADVEPLIAALGTESDDVVIALRGRRRWVRAFERVRLAREEGRPARLRSRGVYLITGGLGRIGLEVAAYLAGTAAARIVLVGRSPFPPEETWDTWPQASTDDDAAVGRKIRRLRDLQAAGAEVAVMRADVSDGNRMRQVVDEIHCRFGPIHGVVHAAGYVDRSGFEPIETLRASSCAAHFRPKRDGLLVLDAVLRDEPLDFCLLCSSVSSLLGGAGYGAYAAANAFMDAFAQRREQAGGIAWTSVNWDGWEFGRPATDRNDDAYGLAMSPHEGIEALDRLLRIDPPVPQVIVSTGDLDARLAKSTDRRTGQQPQAPAAGAWPAAIVSQSREGPARHAEWATDVFERLVCDIWEQVLGLRPDRPDEDFFEAGGNSLTAIRVLSELRNSRHRDIPLEVVFTYATAGQLASWVREHDAEDDGARETIRSGGDAVPGSSSLPFKTELQRRAVWLPLVAQSRPAPLPVSYAQQRLWFIDRLEGGSTEYNLPEALRLRGPLDTAALERAIGAIVTRHESLRTHFADVDGTPAQIIDPMIRLTMPVEDLRDLAEDAQPARIQQALRQEREEPFDLTRGPLMRVRLLQFGVEDHVLVRTLHHIVSDAWSEGVFNRELVALYAALREGREDPLQPLPVQYADFALWQRQRLEAGALDEGLAYWTRHLAGRPEQLTLPADRPRPPQQTFAADRVQALVPPPVLEALKQVSQQHQATLYMSLLASFGVLLARYSGQDDVIVGSPIANRQDAAQEGLIGFFVNSLVLRSRITPEREFGMLLREVRRTALDAYRYQDVPFERIVEALTPPRRLNIAPLFQVSFAFQNTPWALPQLAGLSVTAVRADELRVSVDLEVYAFEEEGQLRCTWVYNRDLFDRWRIEQMARHYLRVLEAVAADSAVRVGEIPLLDAEERTQLLEAWNPRPCAVPASTVSALFEEQVRRTPDAVALVCGDQSLSYAALNERANQLAHLLIAQGVTHEAVVGVAIERSLNLAIALLATLKTGGACLPLDTAHPPPRTALVLQDAQVACVLATSAAASRMPGVRPYLLDDPSLCAALAKRSTADPIDLAGRGLLRPQHAAYVTYTSGSTGRPRGVIVSHGALVNKVWTWNDVLGVSGTTRSAVTSSTSFDPLFEQLFCPLIGGGTAVLAPDLPGDEAGGLCAYVERHQITVMDGTPALAEALLAETSGTLALDALTIGGDVLPIGLARTLRDRGLSRRVMNVYGPTEACIDSTACDVAAVSLIDSVPIGAPLPNYRLYVLDGRLQPSPIGVIGELYIAGVGLARGYVRQPALTAARFVADPYGITGTRMYRTGDRARWRADGRLAVHGRSDDQVKIRGVRVELGDVECALRQCPGVADAAAVSVAHEDRPDDPRLVGYVVPARRQTLEPGTVRRSVAQHLPDAFVPSIIVVLDSLPLTPHGKVDRRALPPPAAPTRERSAALRTPEEELLGAAFAEVLGVARIGLDDDFFELGGHSLLVMRAASRIRATLRADLPIRAFFEAPTVRELSLRLHEHDARRRRPPLVPRPRPAPLPASYAQQRLWFIDRLEGGSAEYNMPDALRLRGTLDRTALTRAIETIVARHAALRTHFVDVDGAPAQLLAPEITPAMCVDDVRGLDEEAKRELVQETLRREWDDRFDLAQGPLLRLRLLRLSDDEHILVRTLHHIVSDGWSQHVFDRELMVLYEAFSEGRADPLPPLPVQYVDFALWQREWLAAGALDEGLAYWMTQLASIPERLTLPSDRSRPLRQTFIGARLEEKLEAAGTASLKQLSRQQRVTLFMTLLAGFGVLLARHSGQDDIVVGSPIANRQDAAVEDLIGFFVNSLVLRLRVVPAQRFTDLLQTVRQTTLDAYHHQDVPFDRIVEALAPPRRANTPPVFQVTFSLQDGPLDPPQLTGLVVEGVVGESTRVRFDLEVHAFEHEGTLRFAWVYNTALFDRWRIEQLARHYVRVLRTVAATPEWPIHRLTLMDATEMHTLLERFNATT